MIGGFQVGPFQLAYQQGVRIVRDTNGERPRRRAVFDEVPTDDEDVIRLFADAVNRYIKTRMEN